MTPKRMHRDEIDIGEPLVRALLNDQFPSWADLPLARFDSSGTVNAIYRLGADMQVRLPLRPPWPADFDAEFTWLPWLAPQLPLAIPHPLAAGVPGQGYPSAWSVFRWLDGETARVERTDMARAASDLADFLAALRKIDVTGARVLGPHERGGTLRLCDERVRSDLRELEGLVDVAAVAAAWDECLDAPAHAGPPVWVHGDVLQENVLVDPNGRITAVIDFNALGAGDPATDLMIAWNLLTPDTREVFRSRSGLDDTTWIRGRGWAIYQALMAWPYYLETNPVMVDNARRIIEQILLPR